MNLIMIDSRKLANDYVEGKGLSEEGKEMVAKILTVVPKEQLVQAILELYERGFNDGYMTLEGFINQSENIK